MHTQCWAKSARYCTIFPLSAMSWGISGSEDCLYLNVWSPQKCHSSSNASCSSVCSAQWSLIAGRSPWRKSRETIGMDGPKPMESSSVQIKMAGKCGIAGCSTPCGNTYWSIAACPLFHRQWSRGGLHCPRGFPPIDWWGGKASSWVSDQTCSFRNPLELGIYGDLWWFMVIYSV